MITSRFARLPVVVWLFLCPLIVGIARGDGLMVLRPNEVLLLALLIWLGICVFLDLVNGNLWVPPASKTDGAVMGLVICGTALPILIGIGRGTLLERDDFLYALVMLKYAVVYGIVRLTVRSTADLKSAIVAIIVASFIVAVVALLQSKDLLGVQWLLANYYDDPFEGDSGVGSLRATSTIASSFGLSDVMAMAFGLSISLIMQKVTLKKWERYALLAAIPLFVLSLVAAGSFSGVIGAAVVILVVGVLTKRIYQLFFVAVMAVPTAVLFLWPTISARLEGFSGYRSLPRSWIGRLDNLERFFWPELGAGWNWLIGVRPAARVAAPESWREWVYIESGYTWLVWTGGFPLLVAFLYFLWAIGCDLLPRSRGIPPESNALRITALSATAMIATLMLFDPHLTVRGCADLYFPLLALALCRPSVSSPSYSLRALKVNFGLS